MVRMDFWTSAANPPLGWDGFRIGSAVRPWMPLVANAGKPGTISRDLPLDYVTVKSVDSDVLDCLTRDKDLLADETSEAGQHVTSEPLPARHRLHRATETDCRLSVGDTYRTTAIAGSGLSATCRPNGRLTA